MEFAVQTLSRRQFVRHAAEYAARITPHGDHASQFRLSLPDAQSAVAVTDVSGGGLGLRSGVMLPKNLRLLVCVQGVGGSAPRSVTVEVTVRRCFMMDHEPTYSVGAQFVDPSGEDERLLIADAARRIKTGAASPAAGGAVAAGGGHVRDSRG